MSKKIVAQALKMYGLTPQTILDVQKGYRNSSYPVVLQDGRMVNLILYKNEPGILAKITNANMVADFLHNGGFLSRHTISHRLLCLRSGERTQYGALYGYLPGHTIPWEAYTQEHIKCLGKTMSDMHAALQQLHTSSLPNVADEYNEILMRMQDYFDDIGVQAAMTTKLQITFNTSILSQLHLILKASKALPGQQPLHMDFVRGNVLFAKENNTVELTGILDFEKTAYGHPLFDIARTLAFLLVDCKYKSADKIRKYFLISGYSKRGKTPFTNLTFNLQGKKINLLESLVTLFLIHDFYKFLCHNPYEYLSQNEHYCRTRDILASRGTIALE
jgi:Ser/Thr protein kinase RdoA (MazF antagonist)